VLEIVMYWDCICSAQMTLGGDTCITLTQRFWPQSCLTVVESDIMFFSNEDLREEFAMNKHYIGLAYNKPAPLFCVDVDCHKGYVVRVQI
jgi:hypothetical protein